jgi:MEDS: MEthanogen/methylotroph, DcmR Sensory domain
LRLAFYADESSLVDGYARCIESSLKSGNVIIAALTESHRISVLRELEAKGIDPAAAIEQDRYIPVDAVDTLLRLTVDDMPDPIRCANEIGDLIRLAANGVKSEHGRVVVCGEIAPTLLSKNSEGAVKLEHLWDEITRGYGVQTLCGYLSSAFPYPEADAVFQRICAEHTARFTDGRV